MRTESPRVIYTQVLNYESNNACTHARTHHFIEAMHIG